MYMYNNTCTLHLLDDQSCRFSKLIVANSSQILSSIIEPEKLALQGQLASLTADEV